MTDYKLSRDVACAGCAAKLNQKALAEILEGRNFYRSANTIVGIEHFDDAGVYRLAKGLLLVQTVDFFPPIVDDPFTFGQIATANALSDIYVMGATPVTALNICCFPKKYPAEVYTGILDGSAEKLREAECTLLGGHTIEDSELKFGIAATGIAGEKEILRNSTALPGDILFLSKPLGTGIATTAIKAEMCPENTKQQAINSMIALNIIPDLIKPFIHSATDITGFGLAGHGLEMCRGSNVRMRLRLDKLPVFDNITDLINKGMFPAGSYRNKENCIPYVNLKNTSDSDIIFDAQTSGGILIAVSENDADKIQRINGYCRIGEILPQEDTSALLELI